MLHNSSSSHQVTKEHLPIFTLHVPTLGDLAAPGPLLYLTPLLLRCRKCPRSITGNLQAHMLMWLLLEARWMT
jgi:hypothetical protein